MKIFLLEDNLIFSREFQKLCDKKGHELTICNSLEDFEFGDFDVYLIDITFGPNKFSYDIIKEIRSQTKQPIAMFTQHDTPDILERGVEAGADYYIYKLQANLYGFHLKVLQNKILLGK